MRDDEDPGEIAGRVLNAATGRLSSAYFELFGEHMEIPKATPRRRSDIALKLFQDRVRLERVNQAAVDEALHIVTEDTASESGEQRNLLEEIIAPAGIDFISPEGFKQAVWEISVALCEGAEGEIRLSLREFLRLIYSKLASDHGWRRRLNVVPGRNFARAFQWLKELEGEWLLDDGASAFRIVRSSPGRPPLVLEPNGFDVIHVVKYYV